MRFKKPRCVMVYAVAPKGTKPPEANRAINEMAADDALPLVLWHDHFLGELGGVLIYFVENEAERDALASTDHLDGWRVEFRPMIFSHNPAAFDEQIAYTMNAYRGADWEAIQRDKRPSYGDPREEVYSGLE